MDWQEPTSGAGLHERVEALRESEERLRRDLFIEHAPALIAMFDRDLAFTSRGAFGYPLAHRSGAGKTNDFHDLFLRGGRP